MRVVRDASELEANLAQAQTEAGAAFSSPEVYIEKFIEAPRHIEFQVIGDHHGNVEVLGERECSIQRRHQKLIEEAPSPAVSAKQRSAMIKTLREAMLAIGYTNAGTVEFLMDETGQAVFHRSECANPGGASRHGSDHWRGSGEVTDSDRSRSQTAGHPSPSRSPSAVMPSNAASTPSIRKHLSLRPVKSPA